MHPNKVKILVVKPSSLGDILHAAPAIQMLANSGSKPLVSWVANDTYVDFVAGLPGVAEAIPFPRGRLRLGSIPCWVPEVSSLLKRLRQDFQVAVDFQGLQRSGLMTFFSGAIERFGFLPFSSPRKTFNAPHADDFSFLPFLLHTPNLPSEPIAI